jgi:hypothetical protein
MAKPNNAAASILAAQPDASEPLATSAPEDSPGKAPTKPAQPIGPAPLPEIPARADEPMAGLPGTVKCIVSHGVLRRGGKVYETDSIVSLPREEALELVAHGVVKLVRVVAGD